MNEDTKIWFAYAIEDEGTENQRVRVFLSLSEEGLYEQAKYFKVRMRMPDWLPYGTSKNLAIDSLGDWMIQKPMGLHWRRRMRITINFTDFTLLDLRRKDYFSSAGLWALLAIL